MIGVYVLLMLSPLKLLQAGGVYKWVDEKGKVHFGDRPKWGQESQEIKLKKNQAHGLLNQERGRLEKQQRLLDSFERQRSKKKKADADKKLARQKVVEECRRARHTLAKYQRSNVLYEDTPEGRRFLDQQQRDEEEALYKAFIDKNCQ
jgi:hypothetical protein